MTIKVTPSDQLVLHLEDAEEGELLRLQLSDGTSLILTVRQADKGPDLFIDQWLMPRALRKHVEREISRLLDHDAHTLGKWLEERCPCGREPYDFLYDVLTWRCQVTQWWVGKVPIVHLNAPLDDHDAYKPKPWSLGVRVTTFAPAEDWVGYIERLRISMTS